MKCIVCSTPGAGLIGAALAVLVVALTDASAGATYLIAIGFTGVAIALRLGPEAWELWRERWREARAESRMSLRELLGGGRSRGSR